MNKSEEARKARRERDRLATQNMSDGYIRKLIVNMMRRYGVKIDTKNINPELIDVKRTMLKAHRMLKSKKREFRRK